VDQDAREIEREITEAREDLDDDLRELRSHAKSLTDWRLQYRNHTAAALALAFAGGVAVAFMAGSRRSERTDVDEFEPDEFHQLAESAGRHYPRGQRLKQNIKGLTESRAGRQLGDTLMGVFEALVGLASTKAIKAVADFVPGFEDEYEARRGPVGRSHLTH